LLALIEMGERGQSGWENTRLLGMRCVRISVSASQWGKNAEISTERVIRALKRERIVRLCFEKGFEMRKNFPAGEFLVAGSEFYRAAVAGKVMSLAGGKSAALFAEQLTVREEKTLLEMCGCFEKLYITLTSGADRVSENLRSLTGVAAVSNPDNKMLSEIDAAVFFSKPKGLLKLPYNCRAYSIQKEFPNNVRCKKIIKGALPENISELPKNFDEEELLSEALISGTLSEDKLRVTIIKTA